MINTIYVNGQEYELAPGYSRWHIEKGVTGKHHGLSYCEACDYVPPKVGVYENGYLEPIYHKQLLTPYCPNCGRRMRNNDYEKD